MRSLLFRCVGHDSAIANTTHVVIVVCSVVRPCSMLVSFRFSFLSFFHSDCFPVAMCLRLESFFVELVFLGLQNKLQNLK